MIQLLTSVTKDERWLQSVLENKMAAVCSLGTKYSCSIILCSTGSVFTKLHQSSFICMSNFMFWFSLKLLLLK